MYDWFNFSKSNDVIHHVNGLKEKWNYFSKCLKIVDEIQHSYLI